MYRVNYFLIVLDSNRAIMHILADMPSSDCSFSVSAIHENLLYKVVAKDSWYDVKLLILDFAPDVFMSFQ